MRILKLIVWIMILSSIAQVTPIFPFTLFQCGFSQCSDPDMFLTWPDADGGISYMIDTDVIDEARDLVDDEGATEAIVASFQSWEDASGGTINLEYNGQSTVTNKAISSNENGISEIYFVEDWPDDDTSTIAWTGIPYYSKTLSNGDIIEADMSINGDDYVWDIVSSQDTCPSNDVQDIQNVVTHEAGHFIGIDHSCDDFNSAYPSCSGNLKLAAATMAASATPCETIKRDLNSDDIDAVQFLYPESGIKPGASELPTTTTSTTSSSDDNGEGCSCAIGPGSQNGKGTSLFLLAFIPLSLLLWLKRQFLM